MASYSTMNTIPAADVESETPLLSRDINVNAKTLIGGATLAAFVLGALAATTVNLEAPVQMDRVGRPGSPARSSSPARSTSLYSPPNVDLFSGSNDDNEISRIASDWSPFLLWQIENVYGARIIAADGLELDIPTHINYYDYVFYYDSDYDHFVWRLPPFGGAGDDSTSAIYDYDRWTYADEGLYKLWRADGSAGGYYTISFKGSSADDAHLEFTCRANDSWDDLSDEC